MKWIIVIKGPENVLKLDSLCARWLPSVHVMKTADLSSAVMHLHETSSVNFSFIRELLESDIPFEKI